MGSTFSKALFSFSHLLPHSPLQSIPWVGKEGLCFLSFCLHTVAGPEDLCPCDGGNLHHSPPSVSSPLPRCLGSYTARGRSGGGTMGQTQRLWLTVLLATRNSPWGLLAKQPCAGDRLFAWGIQPCAGDRLFARGIQPCAGGRLFAWGMQLLWRQIGGLAECLGPALHDALCPGSLPS